MYLREKLEYCQLSSVTTVQLRWHATINQKKCEFCNALIFHCVSCEGAVDEFSSGVINVFTFDILPQM